MPDFRLVLQVATLGIIQGLTEFIPVSSSGHLHVVPALFNWQPLSTSLILFAHLGTLLALVVFFRHDLWEMLVALLKTVRSKKLAKEEKQTTNILINVLLATIPAGVVGFLVQKAVSDFYDDTDASSLSFLVTLLAMFVLGVIFILSDNWFNGKKTELARLGARSAIFVGASQAVAFIRGTSRSGITLLSGQLVGLNRVEAARFSFLVSIPLVFATSILGVYDILQLPADSLKSELPLAITIMIASFIAGLLAIRYLLEYLQHNGLKAFGWYRIVFALVAAFLIFI